ncbi:UbiA family prenyltransferase [Amycolatopsis sp. NPDC049253]|uniref:UbiA family prenyltransferase n=1 Tax=Amycolatopsis sp. NPDC049253 TaxID=3155274 RepID=UPI0034434AA1
MSSERFATVLRAHVETWRPYTLAFPGLVGLAGAAIGEPRHSVATAVGGPLLAWLGAHYLGDYLDRHLDALAKPQRPIPSGRLTPRAALVCAVACFAGFWLVSLLTALPLAWPAAGITLGVVVYSGAFKARGLAGNLVRGLLTAMAFVYGTMTSVGAALWQIIFFAAMFWAHDAATNLIGALRDVDGDRAGGYHTLPVRRGTSAALRVAAFLYCFAIVAAIAAAIGTRDGLSIYALLLGAASCLGVHALDIIWFAPRPLPAPTALRAHEVFVIERILITAATISLGLGPWITAALLTPIVIVSFLLQKLLRHQHEIAPPDSSVSAVAP